MSSLSDTVVKTASYLSLALGNVVSWAVSVDVGAIGAAITVLTPMIVGAVALSIRKINYALTEANVERMKSEAAARREIEAADKDSLANQIEALRKENRLLMLRLGEKVQENTGAIGRIVSADTGTSLDTETQA